MGKLAITRSEGSQINVGVGGRGRGMIIHKTDARNDVKNSKWGFCRPGQTYLEKHGGCEKELREWLKQKSSNF